MTKIVIKTENLQLITSYEARLIPMIGDEIDLPKKLGIVKVKERVFFVDKPDEVILIVKR